MILNIDRCQEAMFGIAHRVSVDVESAEEEAVLGEGRLGLPRSV